MALTAAGLAATTPEKTRRAAEVACPAPAPLTTCDDMIETDDLRGYGATRRVKGRVVRACCPANAWATRFAIRVGCNASTQPSARAVERRVGMGALFAKIEKMLNIVTGYS